MGVSDLKRRDKEGNYELSVEEEKGNVKIQK
jgi:hypothetical protein